MITTRDIEIIDFLNTYKVAATSTIQEMFFPSLSACQKRMKVMTEKNKIKRMRDSVNNQFIYFIKRPKQLRHSLLVTDFYRELHKQCEVKTFKIEPVLGNIRPDAIFGYMINGKGSIGILEVVISNNGFDSQKYRGFMDGGFKQYFHVLPNIFIVGDKKINGENLNIIQISTKFNFKILV